MKRRKIKSLKYNPKYPLTSMINYALVRVCSRLRTDKVWGYPSQILIEPTSACNLKCPLCPTGIDALGRPKGRMTFEQFKQIVDEIKPYTPKLELAGYGEPCINNDICRMVKYAADAGIYVHMHTNATLINTEKKVSDLVDSGLRLLTLSIDGATQETYEKYRVGGQLSVVLDNLRAIVQEKKRRGTLYPEVVCQVVVTRLNEHEVDDIRQIATEIGVDQFFAKDASLSLVRPVGTEDIPKNLIDRFFPSIRAPRGHKIAEEQIYKNGCSWLYKRAFIMWNGDLTTCCHDPAGVNKMGNIFEAGLFFKVWNSPKYQQLRRQVNKDIRKAVPLCSVYPDRVIIKPKDLVFSDETLIQIAEFSSRSA